MYTTKTDLSIAKSIKFGAGKYKWVIILAAAAALMAVTLYTRNLQTDLMVHAAPTDESCFNFDSETNTIVSYTPNPPLCPLDVEIPATIGGDAVTTIGSSAFASKGITSVVMADSITSIGDSAFSGNSITSVDLSDGLLDIGESAFENNDLTALVIPDQVTVIGEDAFRGNSIANLTLGESVVTIGEYAFYQNDLTTVTIPDSVVTIGPSSFEGNQLTSITLGESVVTIGVFAFAANNIASLTVPDSVVTISQSAFSGNKIETVSFGSSLTTIGALAFVGNKLTEVNLPDSVTTISPGAFSMQSALGNEGQIELFSGDPDRIADYLDTIWFVRVFTEDSSNPQNLQNDLTLESLMIDFNNDGDQDDPLGGHIINPVQATVTYHDEASNELLPDETLTGDGLETYYMSENTQNDMSLYFTVGDQFTFNPPAITGFTTPAPQTPTFVPGVNTINFIYTQGNGNGNDDDSGTDVDSGAGSDAVDDELTNTGQKLIGSVGGGLGIVSLTLVVALAARRKYIQYRVSR